MEEASPGYLCYEMGEIPNAAECRIGRRSGCVLSPSARARTLAREPLQDVAAVRKPLGAQVAGLGAAPRGSAGERETRSGRPLSAWPSRLQGWRCPLAILTGVSRPAA